MRPDASLSAVMRKAITGKMSAAALVEKSGTKLPGETGPDIFVIRTIASVAAWFDLVGLAINDVLEFIVEPMNNNNPNFTEDIDRIFRARNLTRRMIAQRLGNTESAVSLNLNPSFKVGQKNRPVGVLKRFCQILEINLRISVRSESQYSDVDTLPVDLSRAALKRLQISLSKAIDDLTDLQKLVQTGLPIKPSRPRSC